MRITAMKKCGFERGGNVGVGRRMAMFDAVEVGVDVGVGRGMGSIWWQKFSGRLESCCCSQR